MTCPLRVALVVAALCLAFVAGCANALDSKVVGHWVVKGGETTEPTNPFSHPLLSLEIKGDNTFEMGAMEGTWDTTGETLSLHWTKYEGMDKWNLRKKFGIMPSSQWSSSVPRFVIMDLPLTFTLSEGGHTLRAVGIGQGDSSTTIFTKVSS